MQRITNHTFVLTLIALAMVFIVLYMHYQSSSNDKFGTEQISNDTDLSLHNIKYTKTRAGEPLWTLRAEGAGQREDGVLLAGKVKMIFFDRKKGNIHLTADQGQLVPELEKVSFDSNVQVITSQGVTLLTDFLEYDEKEHLLRTDQSAHIFTNSYEATGNGMTIDLQNRTLVLFGDVKAQVSKKSRKAPISGTP